MKEVFLKLSRNKILIIGIIGIIGLIGIGFVLRIALFAHVLAPHDPFRVSMQTINLPPGEQFLMGTDAMGRDIFSKILYGIRNTIIISFKAAFISGLIGITLGSVSSGFQGAFFNIIHRITDRVFVIPSIIIEIIYLMIVSIIIFIVGPGIENITLAIGIVHIPIFAKTARIGFIKLKSQQNNKDIKDIFLTVILPLIAQVMFSISSAIFIEIALSYKGIGLQPPTPSLGSILRESINYRHMISSSPFNAGVTIIIPILSFYILGYSLKKMQTQKLKIEN